LFKNSKILPRKNKKPEHAEELLLAAAAAATHQIIQSLVCDSSNA
jgi:hypothetical protein